jgi:Tfp pilus assembly protein PilX
MKNTTHLEASAMFQAAQAAVRDGEARGLSERTMNKRWKAYHAAQDLLKQFGGW